MELMASCFDKLLKLIQQPIPENVLGKLTFSVDSNKTPRYSNIFVVLCRQ